MIKRKYCAKMIRLIGVETRGKIIVKYYQDSLITLSADVYYFDIILHWSILRKNRGHEWFRFVLNFLCYILQLIHCVVKAHDFRNLFEHAQMFLT